MCEKKRRPMIALGWRSAPAQRCTVVDIKSTPYSTAASAYVRYAPEEWPPLQMRYLPWKYSSERIASKSNYRYMFFCVCLQP